MKPANSRNTLALSAAAFLVDASGGAIFGLFPQLRDSAGLTTGQIGVVSSAGFGALVLGLVVLSPLADSGHSKRMIVASLVALAGALLAFAIVPALIMMTIARIVMGLSAAGFLAAARGYAATQPNAGEILGRLTSAEVAGFVTGPVIGTGLATLGGFRAPFFAMACCSLIAAVGFALRLDDIPARSTVRPPWRQSTGFDLLGQRTIAATTVLGCGIYLPIGAYDSLWSIYLTDLGASSLFVGFSLAAYGLPIVLFAGRAGALIDRRGPVSVLRILALPIAILTAAYGLPHSPWVIVGISIVESCVQAAATPAIQVAMARACPPERSAAGQGLGAAAGFAVAGLVASVAPLIYETRGATVLFSLAGIGALVLLGIGAIWHGADLPPQEIAASNA